MSRTPQRQTAIRLCASPVLFALVALLWAALLTYSPADWPATAAWPQPADPHNWGGAVGAFVAHHLFYYLGAGAYALACFLTFGLFVFVRGAPLADPLLRLVGVAMMVTVFATAAALLPASHLHPVMGPGGVLGTVAADFAIAQFGSLFTLVLLACAFLVALLLAADEIYFGVSRGVVAAGRHSAPALRRGGAVLATAGATVAAGVARVGDRLALPGGSNGNGARGRDSASAERSNGHRERAASTTRLATPPEDIDNDEVADEPVESQVRRPQAEGADSDEEDDAEYDDESLASDVETGEGEPAPEPPPRSSAGPVVKTLGTPRPATPRLPGLGSEGPYRLPSLALLDEIEHVDKSAIELLCREKAYVLEQTLNEFRLEVEVVAIETGPVITVFELKLAPGIKVSQVASLTNDIARALKAPAVRVVAPLPGKNTIGIEVPNVDKEKVRLKDLVLGAGARLDQMAIPLFLGKDASGAPLVSDLSKMPHLLIAGTTGSGKSVCVSSIIMSFLLTRTPAEVNLILVDPKVVELAMFKDIPHLICPIVTEISKAEAILDWATNKMDERYALLAEAGVKDIRAYNRLGAAGLKERMQIDSDEELASIPVQLPYIVIVVDELADLMMTSAKEVEFYLARLAQKSRAVGIHLIVSTQRPQANVVTGLIKSNLPCRIAFRVASRLDSRIVLDQNGGEVLMGQGDMLFLPPGSAKLIRAQGAFVSDEELRNVVRYAREQGQPNYHPELIRIPKAGGDGAGERDELFDQAVDIILETGRGSVSLLQRRLTIGYGRASRLIDQMYEAGLVGEYKGSQAREILVSKEEWQQIRSQRDNEEAAEAAE
ncbi:MAG: DNA translocase FtsK [Phycisphaerae bacterium]|nr:DNA translocase FtsK [Phycisphaerae bacterium]MCZ2398402.1 DNA translocase FtsK [Phycisphaerae bacterium]